MAIDVNEEVKVWGGLTPIQFWLGSGGLLVTALIALLISLKVGAVVGSMFLAVVGGGIGAFFMLQRDLPKNYLSRRFKQEGKFFFITIPGIHGTDLYTSPASERGKRFEREFNDER